MIDLTIGSPVVSPKNPKNMYKLTLIFEGAVNNTLLLSNKDEVIDYIALYKAYQEKLELCWNDWCNVEISHLMALATDIFTDVGMRNLKKCYNQVG